jgi:hypothetical protein
MIHVQQDRCLDGRQQVSFSGNAVRRLRRLRHQLQFLVHHGSFSISVGDLDVAEIVGCGRLIMYRGAPITDELTVMGRQPGFSSLAGRAADTSEALTAR